MDSGYAVEVHEVSVTDADAGLRLDKCLVAGLPTLSRSRVQGLITEGRVCLNGEAVTDASAKVKAGQTYSITVPGATKAHIAPVDIPLNIVFEDKHLLVINKSAGMTVHPAPGHYDDTLVNALLHYCGEELSGIGGVARPGIVHRLDKDTSGLMIVAKNDESHRKLASQLEKRSMGREYLALVWGVPPADKGTIEASLGRSPHNRQKVAVLKTTGKNAITHYEILETYQNGLVSLVKCTLETGRTHQIRVHMAHIGHPVLGDPVYGAQTRTRENKLPPPAREALKKLERQALHAHTLHFTHPFTGEVMSFSTDFPEDMQRLVESLALDE